MKLIQKVLLSGILVVLPLQLCAMRPGTAVDFEDELAAQDAGVQTQKSRAWNLAQYIPSWMKTRKAAVVGGLAVAGVAAAVGGTIGYKKLRAKYDAGGDFKDNVDAGIAGVKARKYQIIGGTAGALALTGLLVGGYKWWTSSSRKAELLDLMKRTMGEDEAVEAVPAWVDGLDALLTVVANDAQVEDAKSWKTNILKKAIEQKSPYFLVNDAPFVAQLKEADNKMGLVELIGQAEAELRLELAGAIIAAHDDNQAIVAVVADEDFYPAVMMNPALLLEEPFSDVLTREERHQVREAMDILAKKGSRLARFLQENGLMPVAQIEAAAL